MRRVNIDTNFLAENSQSLGASWDGEGVNFAIYAGHAKRVELCLFDGDGREQRVSLNQGNNAIFHIYLKGIAPGQFYGYRIEGEYDPRAGSRYNPNKLLLDPYAKAIFGKVEWNDAIFDYQATGREREQEISLIDSAPYVPRSVVVDSYFDWEGDTAPEVPYDRTIIYELHVKGFSALNKAIPEHLRGTYAGLAHPASISYLKSLGVTTVELMPVHHFLSDGHLVEKGLVNYWGYNSIGYFAPHAGYSSDGDRGEQVREFKNMVKALHREGIEVILDVVYNHTAEGNHQGPTLCFKGIDNLSYYRLEESNKRFYHDYTGTGNTLNSQSPLVMRLIIDSLRYWVREMHVDGFRFDLAVALARGQDAVDQSAVFLQMIRRDPLISKVKLIAEPWDLGEDGYQLGRFPQGWSEWNGHYRDTMRRFWRGEHGMKKSFANCFFASPDLYRQDRRIPSASINFITAHDGFTMRDLVSYNDKHNDLNLDGNQDGEDNNHSYNFGVEGEQQDKLVNALREKQIKNFLCTLILSQGVPMIASGDELGKTQKGNNNAYCQDNCTSWLDWEHANKELISFVQELIALRAAHPTLRQPEWLSDEKNDVDGLKDLQWYNPLGQPMQQRDWADNNCFGVFLHGQAMQSENEHCKVQSDSHFLIIINPKAEKSVFNLPPQRYGNAWFVICTTAERIYPDSLKAAQQVELEDRSMLVLRADF